MLPDVVFHLAFSPDGERLAATLGGGQGLRVYARAQGWAEIAHDPAYGGSSFGAAFAPDGRLATTARDGKVRLYAGDLRGEIRPAVTIPAPDGRLPVGIAFSPGDEVRLAIGYDDSTAVTLLDGRALARLPGPDGAGIDGGILSSVAWSADGRMLFAGGHPAMPGGCPVIAWTDAGSGARRSLPAGQDTVMSLAPLSGGDLLVAATDPFLARLRPDGSARWALGPPKADFRGQRSTFSASADGTRIDFGFAAWGKLPARFDLATLTLTPGRPEAGGTAPPRQDGLPVTDWEDHTAPTLDGRRLPLHPYEVSRSLAVHPQADRFVLGTGWWLRAFAADGTPLWTRPVPGVAYAVTITGDGRLVVAAYDDGTLRWHRMSDGAELLAFMPLPHGTDWSAPDWVAWTPEGFYGSSAAAHGVLRWHVNRGWDAPADSIPVENIPGSYRPAVLPLVLQELETPRALGRAVLAEHNRLVMLRTNSRLPPGARLHLLTIGISAYNAQHAGHLRLHYAVRDARGLATALLTTQTGLYADVVPQVLCDAEANKPGIFQALGAMRAGMARGTGSDLAVLHFAGHAALVDGALYLLPVEVDARATYGIKATALAVEELRREVLALAAHGRVLLLLDACHSGAVTESGTALPVDAAALRAGLAAANVNVLTSSSAQEASREDPAWQHGAFTRALLDALTDPAADIDRNGLINANGLARFVSTRVTTLTAGEQTPVMELRYEGTIFAVAR